MNKLSISSIVVAVVSLIVATVALTVAIMKDSSSASSNSSTSSSSTGSTDMSVIPQVGENYVESADCGLNMKMVYVEGGTFQMGSSEGYSSEEPVHSVTLDSYYMAECEVTQAQWEKIMGNNPSRFKGGSKPVECVSWNAANAFCRELRRLTGKNYQLPTEAQWEYAARGGRRGNGSKYSGSHAIDRVAWCGDNSDGSTHPVKQKQANELGLYDMSGNVWEWCQDWYDSYSSDSQRNPQGPSSGSFRVLRGGSWDRNAQCCRVSFRGDDVPSSSYYKSGFRVVCLP